MRAVDSRQYCTPKFIRELWGVAFLLRVLIADLNLPDRLELSACNWKSERVIFEKGLVAHEPTPHR